MSKLSLPVKDFVIKSDFRETREGIGELALSIKNIGLLQPIVVEACPEGYEVKVGRRRFTALVDFLNYETLEEGKHFIIRENLDGLCSQLTENLDREDFKPVEIARLVRAIHERGVEEHGPAVKGQKGGWGLKDTAKLIGRDKGFISRLLKISDNVEIVKNCDNIKEALSEVEKRKGKKLLSAIQQRKAEIARISTLEVMLQHYLNESAENFLPKLENESIDFIFTDPPYGLNLDKIALTDAYEDSPEMLCEKLDVCIPEFYRVIKPDKFVVVWTSFMLFSDVCRRLEAAGFKTSATPLQWIKDKVGANTVNPNKLLACNAECAVYGWKGEGAELTIKGETSTFIQKGVTKNRIHPAQKPESLLKSMIEIFSHIGDNVLDCFAGSASTLRACIQTKRNFIGCEELEVHYNAGIAYTLDWMKKEE